MSGAPGKSALARRIESAIRVADVGNAKQVLGTSERAQGAVGCFYRPRLASYGADRIRESNDRDRAVSLVRNIDSVGDRVDGRSLVPQVRPSFGLTWGHCTGKP